MPAEILRDEGADRDQLEPVGPDVVQRALDKPCAEAVAFELVGDLGVEKDARPGSLLVDELADDAAVQDELVPARLGLSRTVTAASITIREYPVGQGLRGWRAAA